MENYHPPHPDTPILRIDEIWHYLQNYEDIALSKHLEMRLAQAVAIEQNSKNAFQYEKRRDEFQALRRIDDMVDFVWLSGNNEILGNQAVIFHYCSLSNTPKSCAKFFQEWYKEWTKDKSKFHPKTYSEILHGVTSRSVYDPHDEHDSTETLYQIGRQIIQKLSQQFRKTTNGHKQEKCF